MLIWKGYWYKWHYGFRISSFPSYFDWCKDCKAPITSTIQGDLGVIVINTPINQLTEYTLIDNNGLSTKYEFSKDEHRLYYEFQAFQRIIDEKDFDKAQNMLKLSLDVASVMEKGRKQEGVVFDNDQQ